MARKSGLATWSLVLGILALLTALFCLGPLFAIPAVICGHVALSRSKRLADTYGGGGMAIAGLVTGYVSIALSVLIIPMMMAIAIPNFVKARTTAQQNACINNLKQIDAATQQWSLENKKSATDVPTWEDLNPYLKTHPIICPAAGVYTLHSASERPTCSLPNHRLPER